MVMRDVIGVHDAILWEAKPQFLPYFFSYLPLYLAGLVFIVWAILGYDGTLESIFLYGTILALGILISPVNIVYRLLVYRFIRYAVTDKRIIFQYGVIGRDYFSVELTAVQGLQVKVGIMDKLFGSQSGNINIISTRSYVDDVYAPIAVVLQSVPDPYTVYTLLNKISHDIRTDIKYPNARRPQENPGYKTERDI